jgi:hypothetical protein
VEWDLNALSYLAAFGGGLISFLLPCVLPLLPGYLSLITGLDSSELEAGGRKHLLGITRDTSLSIAGFGTVFVLLDLTATSLGGFLTDNQSMLTRISGGDDHCDGGVHDRIAHVAGPVAVPGDAVSPETGPVRPRRTSDCRRSVRIRLDLMHGPRAHQHRSCRRKRRSGGRARRYLGRTHSASESHF